MVHRKLGYAINSPHRCSEAISPCHSDMTVYQPDTPSACGGRRWTKKWQDHEWRGFDPAMFPDTGFSGLVQYGAGSHLVGARHDADSHRNIRLDLFELERHLLSGGLPSARFLDFYTKQFPTTEVNYSFYHLPRPATYEKWARKLRKSFMFAVKASRLITHTKRLTGVEELGVCFCRMLNRSGRILVQFLSSSLVLSPRPCSPGGVPEDGANGRFRAPTAFGWCSNSAMSPGIRMRSISS